MDSSDALDDQDWVAPSDSRSKCSTPTKTQVMFVCLLLGGLALHTWSSSVSSTEQSVQLQRLLSKVSSLMTSAPSNTPTSGPSALETLSPSAVPSVSIAGLALAPCTRMDEITPGTWEFNIPGNVSARYVPATCTMSHIEYNTENLCSALSDAGISSILFLGDSTSCNLFLATIVLVLPPLSAQDTALPKPTYQAIETHCWSDRHDNVWANSPGVDLWETPFTERPRTPCNFARRCDGKLTVESWNAGNEHPKMLPLLLNSLQLASKKDAVIYELGPHFMGKASNIKERKGLLRVFGDFVWKETRQVKNMATRQVFFGNSRHISSKKARVFQEAQSECELAKVNAHGVSIVKSLGAPVFDTYEFTHNIPASFTSDGVHFSQHILAPKSKLLLEALMFDSMKATSRPKVSPIESIFKNCKLKILGVITDATLPVGYDSWLAWVNKQCEDSAQGPTLPFCQFNFPGLWSPVDAKIHFVCDQCPTMCGHGGGDCGSKPTAIQFKKNSAHQLVSIFCPAWKGKECAAEKADIVPSLFGQFLSNLRGLVPSLFGVT